VTISSIFQIFKFKKIEMSVKKIEMETEYRKNNKRI
jgi:hypothetical protein